MRHQAIRPGDVLNARSAFSTSAFVDKDVLTTTQTTTTFTSGSPTETSELNGAQLASPESSTPSTAIIVGSAVGAGVALVIIAVLLVLLWKRNRNRTLREPTAWSEVRVESSMASHGPDESRGTISQPPTIYGAPPCAQTHEPSSPIPDSPPQIPLTPGWPRRPINEKGENSWSGASEKRRERREGRGARQSRLLDDTPFEDILVEEGEGSGAAGRRTPSIAEAENGSVGHSTVPSRAASQRTPSSIRKVLRLSALTPTSWRRTNRTRTTTPTNNTGTFERSSTDRHRSGVSSLWSWSHRATRSEYDTDGEPLPAYTIRRSQSTTRSGQRSRRSSTARLGTLGTDISPPDYPLELARKVAQTYPRMPASPGLPPPPFESQETRAGQFH